VGTKVLLVAAVLAPILVVAAWTGETASSGARASNGTTVRVDSKQTSIKPGSTTTLTDDYLQAGQNVGNDQIACVLTGPGSLAICTATSFLPKGEIVGVGSVTIPPPVNQTTTVVIVGGTGSYSTARGTIDITAISPTGSTNIFHITS